MSTARSIVLFVGAALLCACNDQGDLDRVCQAFVDLGQQPGLSAMTHSQRMTFVEQRVSGELSRLGHVAPLWELIPNYESEARYRMFKKGADELVGAWQCPAMERLAPTLSEPLEGAR